MHRPTSEQTITSVIQRLRSAGCVAADDEAHELLAAAPDDDTLESWITQREAGVPFAWIVGTLRFCGHGIKVDRGVYVPRPQSEELARRAASLLSINAGWAVDLCTGTGAIALHLMRAVPGAKVVGVDIDRAAVTCARRNGVPAVLGDVTGSLPRGTFDVVTAVAPYVPTPQLRLLPADVQHYEPRWALDGGADGLGVVRRIVAGAATVLHRGGWLLIEIGGEQDEGLSPTLAASGFGPAENWFDEDGDLRGLSAEVT